MSYVGFVFKGECVAFRPIFKVVILPSEAIALLEVSLSFRKLVNILAIC